MTPSERSDSLPTVDAGGLSRAALAGFECVTCGGNEGAMRPVAYGPEGQLFQCEVCTEIGLPIFEDPRLAPTRAVRGDAIGALQLAMEWMTGDQLRNVIRFSCGDSGRENLLRAAAQDERNRRASR